MNQRITNDISKIQAAEKQLKIAIDLFFKRSDPVSIHTLVCASHEIIQSLSEKNGIKSMKIKTYEAIKEDKRKKFLDAYNAARNFFKHADKDPDDILKFSPEFTEVILWDAVRLYYFLTKRKVPLFIAYDMWAYTKYPHFYKMTTEEEKSYKEAIGDITYENKDYFLKWISEYEKDILKNIKPSDKLLRFTGKEFGPQKLSFDKDTRVWTSFYVLNEQSIENPSEELILNFYIKYLWSNDLTAEKVALIFRDSCKFIIGEPFIAPDNVTKEPAYFFISYSSHVEHGFLSISKICSLRDSVFSLTYSKKMIGSGEKLLHNINHWLITDFESNNGVLTESGNIGIDVSWLEYLNNQKG